MMLRITKELIENAFCRFLLDSTFSPYYGATSKMKILRNSVPIFELARTPLQTPRYVFFLHISRIYMLLHLSCVGEMWRNGLKWINHKRKSSFVPPCSHLAPHSSWIWHWKTVIIIWNDNLLLYCKMIGERINRWLLITALLVKSLYIYVFPFSRRRKKISLRLQWWATAT